jgi:hypothetical protein
MKALGLLALFLTGCAATVTAYPPPGICAVRGPGVTYPEPGCAHFVVDLEECARTARHWGALPILGDAAILPATDRCMAERGYATSPAGYRAKGAR